MKKFANLAAVGALLLSFAITGPTQAAPLPEQTLVKAKLLKDLQSGHERKGDQIPFEVSEDVRAADQTVLIPKGDRDPWDGHGVQWPRDVRQARQARIHH